MAVHRGDLYHRHQTQTRDHYHFPQDRFHRLLDLVPHLNRAMALLRFLNSRDQVSALHSSCHLEEAMHQHHLHLEEVRRLHLHHIDMRRVAHHKWVE